MYNIEAEVPVINIYSKFAKASEKRGLAGKECPPENMQLAFLEFEVRCAGCDANVRAESDWRNVCSLFKFSCRQLPNDRSRANMAVFYKDSTGIRRLGILSMSN